MNEFYSVVFDDGEEFFFRNRDHAHEFLWQTYLNNCGDESDEDRAKAKQELNDFSLIQGIGVVYTNGFED